MPEEPQGDQQEADASPLAVALADYYKVVQAKTPAHRGILLAGISLPKLQCEAVVLIAPPGAPRWLLADLDACERSLELYLTATYGTINHAYEGSSNAR